MIKEHTVALVAIGAHAEFIEAAELP